MAGSRPLTKIFADFQVSEYLLTLVLESKQLIIHKTVASNLKKNDINDKKSNIWNSNNRNIWL